MGKTSFRHIVIGLGGLGSAAAYWLSQRDGGDVLALEQFELGHARGESEDHSRIIRKTYHTVDYVRYAQAAYDTWAEVEAHAGEELVVKTGELNFWPEVTTLDETAFNSAMAACDVPFERLSAAEVSRRFPQFRFDDSIHAVWQPDGGLLAASKANAAHRRLAARQGAVLRDNAPVEAIRQINGGYEVRAGGQIYEGEKLILAAGPWTNRLLAHFGLSLPLVVTQEQVSYVTPLDAAPFTPERFPVWIWMIHDNYYGFPIYGANGVKIARDRFVPTTAETRSFTPDPENEAQLRGFLERHIPQAAGPLLYSKTCILTHTPDTDFVLDSLPGHPGVFCVVGANHAMKFASVIGRTLADLACTGETAQPIEAFRFGRDALRSTE
ncbi:N-methyl-L-tryptophan oxidase [Paracoccus aminophilus]|uniref:Sarcosine oxidase n=1 Tax=Paracoccus aminophilus JCM 7686 TaxID=1367847 RepID=S5XT72_PARAH|nr:N-methyl-L-tryptophan oxidase [Paracoccus aminophilus]AGT10679.1 sarcosine oxidase [Paracoccus aminophilus JCM 7686]